MTISKSPWTIEPNGTDVVSPDGHVATCETKEDACLIAAAPALLATLQELVAEIKAYTDDWNGDLLKEADNIIQRSQS